jgi:ubiquinone/menaquinone biosynthesis C-methylase UbiE
MPTETAPTEERSRSYYDEFSQRYDARRGGNEPGGYHDLIDDLEVDFVKRFAKGKRVLEVGCGTGLLLSRFADFASRAVGLDLSEGMLAHARARGLEVVQGSATELPFPDATFDVACAFKVLAHIPDIGRALDEMFRVVVPGGVVIGEFYNPYSVRALAKRIAGAQRIGASYDEAAVFTRFDSPTDVARLMPPTARLLSSRGIRIVTPAAFALRVPLVRGLLTRAEHLLADGPLRRLGGFYAVAYQKAR